MTGIPNPRFIIEERREKVLIMLSKGLNESQIATVLKVAQSTVSRDIGAIKKYSLDKLKSIVQDELPYQYVKSLLSMDQIINECWFIYQDQSAKWTNKNKMDALKMIRETQKTRIEIMQTGPMNLRLKQIEQELKDSEEQNQIPQRSFMTSEGLRIQEELQHLRKEQESLEDLR